MPLSPPSKKLSAKAEEMIRTFARKQSLTELHKLYQDLNDRTEHGDHNKCYSHFLFLLGDALIKDVGLNNAESVLEYEAIFIDELFQVGLDNAIADFLDQCKDYDAVTSQLTESKVLELSEKMKTFFLYPKGVIDLDGQQSLIRHFIKLYASGQGHFLVDTKQTAFRLFLMAKKARNIFVYSNFLYSCREENGIYKVSKDFIKRTFHEFNIWLDKFYKKNKLNSHRLQDEEKKFYLYLLKIANDISGVFPSYFQGQLDVNWWGQDEDRSKSLKQSRNFK